VIQRGGAPVVARASGGPTIRRKLTRISVLSSITALVSASLVFLVLDARTFRDRMAGRVRTEARIISASAISPVLFNDPEAAGATLAGLRAESAVVGAAIYAGSVAAPLAVFRPEGAPPLSAAAGTGPSALFADGRLRVVEPVLFEGKPVGSVVVEAELAELTDHQRRYAGIVLVVLGASFLLALAIARRVERTISGPILHLAEVAREVSIRKDYSVRALAQDGDEIGALVATFNGMLDEIQKRDAEVGEARGELELRVERRTRDLAAANKELEAFSYSVSHDLRAPLRAIDGFSKVLLTHYASSLDDRGRHYLARVRAGTQRMSELIDDLLALARLSRKELVRRPVDVSELAQEVAAELARREPSRRTTVSVEGGLTTHADPQLLTIVLENLLGNAWKFTGKAESGRIDVGRHGGGSETVFKVRDNGAGFDMAYADKLFGAFQRLHLDSDFEGTGIGLVTVQRIVSRHGGRVWAEGEVGKGATFYFTLEPKT
jgi:signal transduction histidine kinase